ncbi:hypothetical protein CH260_03870 [Rhodococcus sp. 05-2256-B2]|uniref:hypothetical protein n=1 Tax=Nocardiaceae TaxID=85025 RepID=UPI00050C8589|nr:MULTISPECIES: hypothetical protein [Rhodococcus]OZD78924.1 hypothetical protein CH258_23400 [Rhodococcus sp. 05-2256-B4]OZD94027.1 hypothetical protein CH257_11280 [Rhodococcus sp. 05-2256-B3]OZE01125.1 hypothetical protein CH260_03870 [Rhodococcus sp. 05-2256-B2]OZE04729.1 hypothetical protein CH285_10030 [Rhodococcus sp. 05-2256-B1]
MTWGDCEPAFAATMPDVAAIDRLECATVPVPLNHDVADSPNIDIAISRLPASSGHNRGTLIVNPGGPLEGRSLPATVGNIDGLANWDIVGVDVRGTGASTRPACAALQFLEPPQPDASRPVSEDSLATDAHSYVETITEAHQTCVERDGSR